MNYFQKWNGFKCHCDTNQNVIGLKIITSPCAFLLALRTDYQPMSGEQVMLRFDNLPDLKKNRKNPKETFYIFSSLIIETVFCSVTSQIKKHTHTNYLDIFKKCFLCMKASKFVLYIFDKNHIAFAVRPLENINYIWNINISHELYIYIWTF